MEVQSLSFCTPSKVDMLVFIPRHPRAFPPPVFDCSLCYVYFCHPQYFCIGRYWGWQWLEMRILYSGYEAIICFTYCKQSNLKVVESRNKTLKVGTLASFQVQVGYMYCHGQFATSLVPRPSHT